MDTQNNQTNQENTTFNDQADGKLSNVKGEKLSKGVTSDVDKNLMTDAEAQVRETEDASLQDDTYSFDEDNTDNEEYHDAGDASDFDLDNDDDFIQ